MTVDQYVSNINTHFISGNATEHTYRGDLQKLLQGLLPDLLVTNEPKRRDCGAPDYIITKGQIPVGFIEAKDVGDADLLGKKKNKEQFDRYKAALPNLIFTDYCNFHFYKEGELVTSVEIASEQDGSLIADSAKFTAFENLIRDFSTTHSQTIKSAERLSKMMAGKARLMKDVFQHALEEDLADDLGKETGLEQQFNAFKDILIHDIAPAGFADIYAQTIAYGMFAARLHDPTLHDFSRQEAANLIPKTNPFLRKLFQFIAGYDLDDRLAWVVDSLADIFLHTDVKALLANFGRATAQHDPIIHFYETFLAEYDPKLRKARGVWYTPEPVVNFIVRAVDDVLKTEFGLREGLADTTKTKVKVKVKTKATADRRSKLKEVEVEKEVHKVQILDPATGTGTFLAEVVKQIHEKFKGQEGVWSQYVDNHLLPRLNGFEILMASYAMAHLKLDLLLTETGYKPQKDQRFRVYLTNSLEEHHPDTGTLFASWLSSEANEANHIKRDNPVMVVLGNPPYSGESQNKGSWIMNLMEDYKREPGGKLKLKERNPKWVNDDYVKFLRYGQHFIEQNGEGVLAFINPHGFLDNPTFRGMRWHLLKTYDKIYSIDLHGNSKKKEVCPDGSPDVNVFDIQQGVSINILVKTGRKPDGALATVHHFDLYGKREAKYQFLSQSSLSSVDFVDLANKAPMYFMTQKDFGKEEAYNRGFVINELFPINGNGMTTAHDDFVIKQTRAELLEFYHDFQNSERDAKALHQKFGVKEKKGWDILEGYDNIKNESDLSKFIHPVSYRPFDNKFIFYEDKLVWRTVRKVMSHYTPETNVGLVVGRQGQVVGSMPWNLAFVTDSMTDFNFYYRGGGVSFPLYRYPNITKQLSTTESSSRVPNLNSEIVEQFTGRLDLKFVNEPDGQPNSIAPIDILDYIYAILYSPRYRENYKEFLKVDFPRVPYPLDSTAFHTLKKYGKELRLVHLMRHSKSDQYITGYPCAGNNMVVKPRFEGGRVWINPDQYFDAVPKIAWEFYIGGYQPAQKWLKDRKGRQLTIDEIMHYQKIIVALYETDRIMMEIDKIPFD